MRIQFSTQFGSEVWDGTSSRPLFNAATCNGIQLTGHLETALGLPTLYPAKSVRAASLLKSLLEDESAFYHRAALNDALGVARRLLRDFDTLRTYGWTPHDSDTPRLRQLAQACKPAAPGPAERLARILAAMPTRKARIESISLHEPEPSLPMLWRQVFDKLRANGTRVNNAAGPMVASTGDLAWAATREGTPTGDGSIQLLVASGPLQAADHVGAWLAADGLHETVVVGADSGLDSAMARHGLPALGCPSRAAAPTVQLIPLVVHMAYGPVDPRLAVEFLTISPNPISWTLRQRLLDALTRWPAVDSTSWREALTAHAAEDPQLASDDARALDTFFRAPLERMKGGYPASLLQTRLGALQTFLEAQAAPAFAAVATCERLRAAAQASGLSTFAQGQLQRLVATVLSETPGADGNDAQAGLFCVSNAASIAAPARRIVWWDFTAEKVMSSRGLPLFHADVQCLGERGVELPSPAALAADLARTWRAPLMHARDSLLLVAPRTSATGEKTHPHPLWDEIVAAIPAKGRAVSMQKLLVSRPAHGGHPLPLLKRQLRPLPRPITEAIHITSRSLKRDGAESPHSIETMLGCSVKWALHYLARLQASRVPPTQVTPLQTGSFAHHLLETLVMQPFASPQAASDAALTLFDSEAPRHLAPLYLPGNAPQRHSMRMAFAEAVSKLTQIRAAHGWRIAESEVNVSKSFYTIELRGILDARLDNPIGVMDFKWSGSTKYRRLLEESTALQLGIYSYLCAEDESKLPPIAYYVLDKAKLLTPEFGAVAGALPLRRASVETIWQACKAAMIQTLDRLQTGELSAPANLDGYDAKASTTVVSGVLQVAPPCMYCDFSALCGAMWRESV